MGEVIVCGHEGQAIATDVPCVGCGYNLRMQPVEGACPECGLAVKESLEQTILKWGSSRLRRIAWALRIQAVTIIMVPVTYFGGALAQLGLIRAGIDKFGRYTGIITIGAILVVCVVHAAAAWFATSAPHGETGRVTRWLCRLGSLALPATLFVALSIVALQHLFLASKLALLLAATLLLLGWALYAERAAAWWNVFHRRAGLSEKAGLGKWSMRGFALAMAILSIGSSATIVSELALEWDFLNIDGRTLERLESVISPILLGTLAMGGIFLILIIIALFRAGNRVTKLAKSAQAAETGGFTAPLASAIGAPPCS